ncbi:MAG: hypothetical protein GEU73_12185 [Chloroflexi bacterium]|nr:hypothetical protein [Chloroflexota bacterium]
MRLSRSYCVRYRRRLGFVLKRPKKRFLKAVAEQRETFVREYAALDRTSSARRGN